MVCWFSPSPSHAYLQRLLFEPCITKVLRVALQSVTTAAYPCACHNRLLSVCSLSVLHPSEHPSFGLLALPMDRKTDQSNSSVSQRAKKSKSGYFITIIHQLAGKEYTKAIVMNELQKVRNAKSPEGSGWPTLEHSELFKYESSGSFFRLFQGVMLEEVGVIKGEVSQPFMLSYWASKDGQEQLSKNVKGSRKVHGRK